MTVGYDRLAQREAARHAANRKRTAVAVFKNELRALPREDACEHLALLLERRTPHPLDHGLVYALLTAIPYVGGTKARKVLREAGIQGPDRRLREMTPRQRNVIAERIRWFWS